MVIHGATWERPRYPTPPPLLLIQLEDVLTQCIPPEQTGFIKHRSILRHIYSARSLWESFAEGWGATLSIDFRNAFPTMSHALCDATSEALAIPTPTIALIMHLLQAPYLFSVGQGYVPDIALTYDTTPQPECDRGTHCCQHCFRWCPR